MDYTQIAFAVLALALWYLFDTYQKKNPPKTGTETPTIATPAQAPVPVSAPIPAVTHLLTAPRQSLTARLREEAEDECDAILRRQLGTHHAEQFAVAFAPPGTNKETPAPKA